MSFIRFVSSLGLITVLSHSCSPADAPVTTVEENESIVDEAPLAPESLIDIDLNHWKVTLPIGNPTEVEPPEILDYASNPLLMKYMYNSESDTSLVFYTEPGSSTRNSSYSRTELREQMEPGSNTVNWTFAQGGTMKGRLKVARVSGEAGKLDRIIVMQIHGRLTNQQRDLIGQDDNNAPPVLKIYWDDGKIDVRRKVLRDITVSDEEILSKAAWKDESHFFQAEVGYEAFDLEINASGTVLRITLNDGEEELRFDDIHTEKWGVFENYFKAGNYLQTSAAGTYSEVRYYELEVMH